MRSTSLWILGLLALLLVLAFFFGGWIWRPGWVGNVGCPWWSGSQGAWGARGPGMMGSFAPFAWIGMLFMVLIPLGILILTVLGILWLVRAVSGNVAIPPASRACPNCGKNVLADWQHCPHCGTTLNQAPPTT